MITNSHIRFFNIYLLPSILFVISYIVFGSYYGSGDDATMQAVIRGIFFSHPVTELYAFHRITAILYARLYELFPNIPWYGIFMHALLFLAITNYFVLIHRHLEKFIANYALLTPLLMIFYVVFFLDSVVFITYTKVSILLAASSILLIIDGILKAEEVQQTPYWHIGWYFLLFILGFLTRPQAGILCIILLLPFAVLYNPTKRRLLRVLCVFVALISVVGALKLYDSVTRTEGSRYYWSVVPYVLNIFDFKAEGKNLDGPQDSMKYRAIAKAAFGDRAIVNVDFLSRVSSDQIIDVGRVNTIDIARGVQTIDDEISPYHLLIVFGIIAAALVLTISYRHELPFIFRVNFLAFSIFYWSVVVSIAVFWKMHDRVLSPVVVTYITSGLLFIAASFDCLHRKINASDRFSVSSKVVTSLWIITLVVLLFAGYRKIPAAKMEARVIEQISPLREVINRELADKIVVFTFNASQGFLAHQPLFSVGHLSTSNRYLLVDGVWPTLLPQYPQRLKEITGSERLSDVFQFFLKNRDKVIFVSTPNRNAFIQEYFATLYNSKFTFEEFKQSGAPSEVRLYTIKAAG